MSIEKVRKAAEDFLADKEPGALSIKGSWGVGKTYFWSNLINTKSNADDFSINRYAYVSLFGITSLDELKFSIFEHIVNKLN